MSKLPAIVWLTGGSGPLSEQTLRDNPSASVAGARWQAGLISGLMEVGCPVWVVGHVAEGLWPKGRLFLNADHARLAEGFAGSLVSYWNVPFVRTGSVVRGYRREIKKRCETAPPDVVMSYNLLQYNYAAALYAKHTWGVPWVSINADHWAHRGSAQTLHHNIMSNVDGALFLPWNSYTNASVPALHLDGGVYDIQAGSNGQAAVPQAEKIILYTGGLHPAKGTLLLAEAFQRMTEHQDAQLWYCGQGNNPELQEIARQHPRIKLLGLVSEARLAEISAQATVFVNPRIPSVYGNNENFPSKILEYLRYCKPVVSTWTDGLAPDYRKVLIVSEPDSGSMADALTEVLSWDEGQQRAHHAVVQDFMADKLWRTQASRVVEWLQQRILTSGT